MADERSRPKPAVAAPAEDEPAGAVAAPAEHEPAGAVAAPAEHEPTGALAPPAGDEPAARDDPLTEAAAPVPEVTRVIGVAPVTERGPTAGHAEPIAVKAQLSETATERGAAPQPGVETPAKGQAEVDVEVAKRRNLVPIRVESADDTAEIPVPAAQTAGRAPIRDRAVDDTAEIRRPVRAARRASVDPSPTEKLKPKQTETLHAKTVNIEPVNIEPVNTAKPVNPVGKVNTVSNKSASTEVPSVETAPAEAVARDPQAQNAQARKAQARKAREAQARETQGQKASAQEAQEARAQEAQQARAQEAQQARAQEAQQARAQEAHDVVAQDGTAQEAAAQGGEPVQERPGVGRASGLGQAPWILALSSSGVLLVALGYAGGRDDNHLAMAAYWIGQIVVFTPVVVRLLTRRLAGIAESFVLVMGLAVNQYLLKWCYSPDQFRFPDELQHWLATTIINRSGELFRPNLALPPAVHFPGLAEMGAAVSQLTGLPVTAAGIIVAGVCHLGLVAGLYLTVLRASRSPATAGVTCVVYATSLHYLFFNSMYLYQTAALAFLMLTIWASRRWRAGDGSPFAVLAVAGTVVTTVCHHVTAGALVMTLLLVGIAEVATVRPRPWKALILPGVAVAVVAFWILVVARDVIAYLDAPLHQVVQSLSQFAGRHPPAGAAAPSAPLWQLGIQALGLLFLLGLFLAVAQEMLGRRNRDPWLWAALAGSVVFFAGNGVRFLGANGPEIAGRLSTFTYVPMSIIAAVALVRAVRLMRPKSKHPKDTRPEDTRPEDQRLEDQGWRRWLVPSPEAAPAPIARGRTVSRRLVTGAVMITVLMAGARVGGWPPAKQLLPGPYLADGFERSVDAYGTDAADWEYQVLGPGRRTGGDLTAIALASTYGRQDPVRGVGPLFYAEQWSDDDETLASTLALRYLVVDKRLAEQPPAQGQYFDDDPHTERLTAPELGKFDDLPQWSRLYDNGEVRIYQVGG